MPGCNNGTNTIVFIKKNKVPQDRAKDVTYDLITCLIRPVKIEENNQTRLVAGGDRVHYPGDSGTPTANLLTVKLLINSTISTPNAKYIIMDIHLLRVGWRNFFSSCAVVSDFGSGGK
jgi:hypothetical protein